MKSTTNDLATMRQGGIQDSVRFIPSSRVSIKRLNGKGMLFIILRKIPQRNRAAGDAEHKILCVAVERGIYTYSEFNREFEKWSTEFVGINYCALCSSESSANLLAITSLTGQNWKHAV